jgi:hypothetical protein
MSTQVDPLATYRQEVEEAKTNKPKMSEVAIARFREVAEQGKVEAAKAERFRSDLRSVTATPENLRKLIERCNTGRTLRQVGRRAHKLQWWIDAGFELGREIDSVTQINYFSELTAVEEQGSEADFLRVWNPIAAKNRRESRLNRGLMPLTVAGKAPYWNPKRCLDRGLCKAGSLCLKAANNDKPAPAATGKQYCTENCQESYPIRLKVRESKSGGLNTPSMVSGA